MKKTTLLFFLFLTAIMHGQLYVDMTQELADIKGHLAIDGNTIQAENNTKEQIIITGKNMVINDRSSFNFHNVIVQLDGEIITKGVVKPTLIDSYIFCKKAKTMKSKCIIEVSNFDEVAVGEVEYIKKLKGNPELRIYSVAGNRVFKGTKMDAAKFRLPISRYDVKVVGFEFKDKVAFF